MTTLVTVATGDHGVKVTCTSHEGSAETMDVDAYGRREFTLDDSGTCSISVDSGTDDDSGN